LKRRLLSAEAQKFHFAFAMTGAIFRLMRTRYLSSLWLFISALPAAAADAAAQPAPAKANTAADWTAELIHFVGEHGPKLLGAILVLAAGFLLSGWIGSFVQRGLEKKQLEPPIRMLMSRIVRLLILGLALMVALETLGIKLTAVLGLIGVAGLGAGLAMQGVLSNLVAGLTIIFTKPFRVGEYVELVGVQGQVETIELFNTVLTHADRSRVVIPNRKLVGEVLHNYGTIRQLDLQVGVAYNCNVTETLGVVREVLASNPRVIKELTPGVGVNMLADSSINIAIKPWVKVADYGPAQGELYLAILERFRQQKIEIPFPQRDIRLLDGAGALGPLTR
jgi:small conductance mechanosensitive channel